MVADAGTLHDFIEDRVRRGYMVDQSFGRFARLVGVMGRGCWARPQPPVDAGMSPRLRTRAIAFGRAAAYVAVHHRHLLAPPGHVYAIAVYEQGVRLCGVAIVGRPVARMLDNGSTLEITRVATDGTRNACSALYGAACREAKRRGIKRLVTYTLPEEGGASLRGAGFVCEGPAGGGTWSRPSRTRKDGHPIVRKTRWSWWASTGSV